jgi:hypothetical protein
MGCCSCCLSEDGKIQVILRKLDVARASQIQPGMTKFVVGRVILSQRQKVIAPVSQRECAYFEFHCERLHTYKDEEGNTHKQWVHFFDEYGKADFLLGDPEGQVVYVPASSHAFKMYTKEDSGGQEGGQFGSWGSFEPSDANPHLRGVLERHGALGREFFGIDTGPAIRYREGSFTANELVAILGTASQSQVNGSPCLLLSPVASSALSEEYFEKNEWSGMERKCWEKLTSESSFLGTDDGQYMKVLFLFHCV